MTRGWSLAVSGYCATFLHIGSDWTSGAKASESNESDTTEDYEDEEDEDEDTEEEDDEVEQMSAAVAKKL